MMPNNNSGANKQICGYGLEVRHFLSKISSNCDGLESLCLGVVRPSWKSKSLFFGYFFLPYEIPYEIPEVLSKKTKFITVDIVSLPYRIIFLRKGSCIEISQQETF